AGDRQAFADGDVRLEERVRRPVAVAVEENSSSHSAKVLEEDSIRLSRSHIGGEQQWQAQTRFGLVQGHLSATDLARQSARHFGGLEDIDPVEEIGDGVAGGAE